MRDFGDVGTSPKFNRVVSVALIVGLTGGLAFYAHRNGSEIVGTWRRFGAANLGLAFALGTAGIGLTWIQWRTILSGLGVQLAPASSARIFFVSQLGKYVPGAIWPTVMQVEFGRRQGARASAILLANLIVLTVSLTTALVLALILLPFSSANAVERYWWAFMLLPLALVALHPRLLSLLIQTVTRRAGRDSNTIELPGAVIVRALMWSVASWLLIGAQTSILLQDLGAELSVQTIALSIGGTGLAMAAGILLVPAPAGAGAREAVLVLVLSARLSIPSALTMAIASRVVLLGADLILALGSWCLSGATPSSREAVRRFERGSDR